MGEVTIFNQGAGNIVGRREPTALGKTLAESGLTFRRIQTNVNGTFKRLVNGDQIGPAIRGEINVIIVGALAQVSRIYYREKYDPNKEATLPNCWSNMGEKPEPEVEHPQSDTCLSCKQNVKGSADNGGRACRYQRRLSVLAEGDTSGEIYQINIPAKSLFGKGHDNVHPFESYVKYLAANGESPDTVVTKIAYDPDAESMELQFSPERMITDDEYQMVLAAQAHPDCNRYTQLTVAQADRVTKPAPETAKEPETSAQAEGAATRRRTKNPEPDEPPFTPDEPELQKKAEVKTDAAKASLAAAIEEWTEK
jgi:hypothetical protein